MARRDGSRARTDDTPLPGPVRTCVGCRDRAARNELLRVVAGSDDQGRPVLAPDPDRTAPGRGAHLHPTFACYDLAVRRRAFGRALRVPGALPAEPVADYLGSLPPAPRTAGPDRNAPPTEAGARSS